MASAHVCHASSDRKYRSHKIYCVAGFLCDLYIVHGKPSYPIKFYLTYVGISVVTKDWT